jgi:hypothetical protein
MGKHQYRAFPLRLSDDIRAEVMRAAEDQTNSNATAWILNAVQKELNKWRKKKKLD